MTLVTEWTSRWRAEHVSAILEDPTHRISRIDPQSLPHPLPGHDLWDMWPVQHRNGRTARFDGWEVWMVLSAPIVPDPDDRHHFARIRLFGERDGEWRGGSLALPDGFNPGNREWAGSAVFDDDSITLYFTAAGERGNPAPNFAQRIFSTTGRLECIDGVPSTSGWSPPFECLKSDGADYLVVGAHEGRPGFIKGFRDPAFFEDPADGMQYLLFTGSLRRSASPWNGCIGIARRNPGGVWALLPPLMSADGVNNEMERPHIVVHGGSYYLFWSTQRRTFADGGPSGPNGLYGMVAPRMCGPYTPLNGTGLVAANPPEAPFQAYSWWVTHDLQVAGFVDLIGAGSDRPVDDPAWRRAHFGGVPAPRFGLRLDGLRAVVA